VSRTRILFRFQDAYNYTGAAAFKQLEKLVSVYGLTVPTPTGVPRWQWAVSAFKTAKTRGYDLGHLFVYREPRRIKTENSRYKQEIRTLFGLPVGTQPAPPRRGNRYETYRRANQEAINPMRGGRRPQAAGVKTRSRAIRLLEQELMQEAF
jgi:hypothetical protein